jgi:putative peptide zinc metalloprotease protein
MFDELKAKLQLRAPLKGVVMSPPQIDEIGKYFERDATTPFCSIGDPLKLRALMPVPPIDYNLLNTDRKALTARGEDLGVTIRVHGRDAHTWSGKINHMEESEAKQVPVQLTDRGGGNIAVKPISQPGMYVPQSQYYLVYVDFIDPDRAIQPGTIAQVKIHCQWQTAWWWTWRTFCSAFDIGWHPTDLLPRWLRWRS